jgi:hypothetical protein
MREVLRHAEMTNQEMPTLRDIIAAQPRRAIGQASS